MAIRDAASLPRTSLVHCGHCYRETLLVIKIITVCSPVLAASAIRASTPVLCIRNEVDRQGLLVERAGQDGAGRSNLMGPKR